MILEEIGRYDHYTDKFIKNTTTNRIEVGTDENLYRLSISNGNEYLPKCNGYLPKDKLYTKANMMAMLEEIKDEAKKLRIQKARENVFGREFKIEDYDDIIQSKIDKLKGE